MDSVSMTFPVGFRHFASLGVASRPLFTMTHGGYWQNKGRWPQSKPLIHGQALYSADDRETDTGDLGSEQDSAVLNPKLNLAERSNGPGTRHLSDLSIKYLTATCVVICVLVSLTQHQYHHYHRRRRPRCRGFYQLGRPGKSRGSRRGITACTSERGESSKDGQNETPANSRPNKKRLLPAGGAPDPDDDGNNPRRGGDPDDPDELDDRDVADGDFACHFFLFDPYRLEYYKCATHGLKRIKDVKQHIQRRHTDNSEDSPLKCPRCFFTCSSQVAFDSHSRAMSCELSEKLSKAEFRLVQRLPNVRGAGGRAKWYDVWRLLFALHPPPLSPYLRNGFEEWPHRLSLDPRLEQLLPPGREGFPNILAALRYTPYLYRVRSLAPSPVLPLFAEFPPMPRPQQPDVELVLDPQLRLNSSTAAEPSASARNQGRPAPDVGAEVADRQAPAAPSPSPSTTGQQAIAQHHFHLSAAHRSRIDAQLQYLHRCLRDNVPFPDDLHEPRFDPIVTYVARATYHEAYHFAVSGSATAMLDDMSEIPLPLATNIDQFLDPSSNPNSANYFLEDSAPNPDGSSRRDRGPG